MIIDCDYLIFVRNVMSFSERNEGFTIISIDTGLWEL